MGDELRILRQRHERLARSLAEDGVSVVPDCGASHLVVTTTVSTYPTTPHAYYAVNDQEANGDEIEGEGAGFLSDTVKVWYALNVGAVIPPPERK